MKTRRIDKFLVDRINLSRNKIVSLIEKKLIEVNGNVINDKSHLVNSNDEIIIKKIKVYVSRGAYKLLHAIKHYKINLENKICLDVGCSTGGFSQVMLEGKAKFIYAIDVGYKQFNRKLLSKTNFLNLNRSDFEHKIDFIACDVSFISLTKIIEHINKIFAYPFKLVCLIKPEFELTPKIIAKNKGHVDLKYHKKVIEKILSLAKKLNLKIHEPVKSPIVGAKKGNIEYLIWFGTEGEPAEFNISDIVETAHKEL